MELGTEIRRDVANADAKKEMLRCHTIRIASLPVSLTFVHAMHLVKPESLCTDMTFLPSQV